MQCAKRLLHGWLGWIAVASVASTAQAAEPRPIGLRVTESVHAECPAEPTFFARVQVQLPHVYRASPGDAAMKLELHVERGAGNSYGTLTFDIGDAVEKREASSSSCSDVLSALAMMAAIVIGEESERVDASTPPESAGPLPIDDALRVQASPTTTPRPVVRPPPPRYRLPFVTWAFGVGAESAATTGRAMLAKWFVQVTAPLALEPTLRLGLARSTRTDLRSRFGSVSVRFSELALSGCATVVRRSWMRLGSCVDIEMGALDASVTAPPSSRNFSYPWVSAGASALMAYRLAGPAWVEGGLGLHTPFMRDELYFEPNIVVHRVPVLIPYASASVIVDFR